MLHALLRSELLRDVENRPRGPTHCHRQFLLWLCASSIGVHTRASQLYLTGCLRGANSPAAMPRFISQDPALYVRVRDEVNRLCSAAGRNHIPTFADGKWTGQLLSVAQAAVSATKAAKAAKVTKATKAAKAPKATQAKAVTAPLQSTATAAVAAAKRPESRADADKSAKEDNAAGEGSEDLGLSLTGAKPVGVVMAVVGPSTPMLDCHELETQFPVLFSQLCGRLPWVRAHSGWFLASQCAPPPARKLVQNVLTKGEGTVRLLTELQPSQIAALVASLLPQPRVCEEADLFSPADWQAIRSIEASVKWHIAVESSTTSVSSTAGQRQVWYMKVRDGDVSRRMQQRSTASYTRHEAAALLYNACWNRDMNWFDVVDLNDDEGTRERLRDAAKRRAARATGGVPAVARAVKRAKHSEGVLMSDAALIDALHGVVQYLTHRRAELHGDSVM